MSSRDAFDRDDTRCLLDRDDNFAVLFRTPWALVPSELMERFEGWAEQQSPKLRFLTTAPLHTDTRRNR